MNPDLPSYGVNDDVSRPVQSLPDQHCPLAAVQIGHLDAVSPGVCPVQLHAHPVYSQASRTL